MESNPTQASDLSETPPAGAPDVAVERMTPESRGRSEFDEIEYRPLSGLAMAGLLTAFVSPLAFWHPVLWILPVTSIFLSAAALRNISRTQTAQAGRGIALTALTVSLAIGAAAPARLLTRQYLLQRQARQFADQWFTFMRRGEPQYAHQLTVKPANRGTLDESVWEVYRNDENLKTGLEMFVTEQPNKALLALRDTATVRFYGTEMRDTNIAGIWVTNIYAVTFPHRGVTKTFFVSLKLLRSDGQQGQGTGWRLSEYRGPYRPKSWQGQADWGL
jgi:hypothetical protein